MIAHPPQTVGDPAFWAIRNGFKYYEWNQRIFCAKTGVEIPKEKLYVVQISNDSHWGGWDSKDASPGNHFELVKTDNIDGYVWEEMCQIADSQGSFEEEEWGDFVERNAHSYYFEYDPALKAHVQHKGYEDERPEHVAWAKKDAIKQLERSIRSYNNDLDKYVKEIGRIDTLIRKASLDKALANEELRKLRNE